MKTILSIESLTVRFKTSRGVVTALENVSLDLEAGEIFALLGETGSGKSVFGRCIMGLPGENARVGGSIRFKEKELLALSEPEFSRIRGNEISIILQNPDLALNPVLPIGRQLTESLEFHRKMDKTAAKARVIQSLEQMGFDDSEEILNKYPFQMSGGMLQRILIAAAVVTEPQILIADEPTRALDSHLKEAVKARLAHCRDVYGTAILLITHDIGMAAALARRVGVMYAGEMVEIIGMSEFLKEPRHPYSKALVNSYTGNNCDYVSETLTGVTIPLTGCRYAPRCPYKESRCLEEKPGMVSLQEGDVRCLLYPTDR